MAQAEMALEGMGLASPLPTAAPSPLELARRILPRQIMSETCVWVDADSSMFDSSCRRCVTKNHLAVSPMACRLGYVCGHNTGPAYNAAFCCDALSFPANCPFATTCLDSTDVAASCTGLCLENTAVAKWYTSIQIHRIMLLIAILVYRPALNSALRRSTTIQPYQRLSPNGTAPHTR